MGHIARCAGLKGQQKLGKSKINTNSAIAPFSTLVRASGRLRKYRHQIRHKQRHMCRTVQHGASG
jgi:hypothetical protein